MTDQPDGGVAASIDATYAIRQPALPAVAGRCPACGGESLMLADGGYVTCRRDTCPQPDAAHEAIEERTGANAYDRAINAPMSEAAAAHLRERLASGNVARRKVRRREPTPECGPDFTEQHSYRNGCAAGYCLHCGRGDAGPTADMYEASQRRAIRIQTLLDGTRDRVRKIHQRSEGGSVCVHCSERDYPDYTVPWPCPTIAALEPPKAG